MEFLLSVRRPAASRPLTNIEQSVIYAYRDIYRPQIEQSDIYASPQVSLGYIWLFRHPLQSAATGYPDLDASVDPIRGSVSVQNAFPIISPIRRL